MDPKRKKLYIIIMILCVLASVSILLWGRGGSPSIQLSPSVKFGTADNTSAGKPQPSRVINPDATYLPPPVFPQSQTIDASVLTASGFTSLQDFQATQLDPNELGRDNPLKKY